MTLPDFKALIPYYRRNMSISLPLVVSSGGVMLIGLVDSAMIGHVGTIPLAASAFANSLFNLMLVAAIGIAYGLTPLVGEAFGKKQTANAAGLLAHAVILNTVFIFILCGILLLLYAGMPYMGQDPSVLEEAKPYFLQLTLSLVPLMYYFTFRQFLQGLSVTLPELTLTVFTNLLNAGLNYIFIYGMWSIPAMGLVGAGWATVISRLISPLWMVIYILRTPEVRAYAQNFFRPVWDFRIFKSLTVLGLPIAAQMFVETTAFGGGGLMLGMISPASLAAHQITLGLIGMTFMFCAGIANGSTIQISIQMARGRFRQMRLITQSSFHLVFLIMSISTTIFIVFRNEIPLLFTAEKEVIEKAAVFFVLGGIFQLSDGLQVCALGVLRGLRDVKIPSVIAVISYWFISLSISWVLAFHTPLGDIGVWIGFIIGLSFAATMFIRRIYKKLPAVV